MSSGGHGHGQAADIAGSIVVVGPDRGEGAAMSTRRHHFTSLQSPSGTRTARDSGRNSAHYYRIRVAGCENGRAVLGDGAALNYRSCTNLTYFGQLIRWSRRRRGLDRSDIEAIRSGKLHDEQHHRKRQPREFTDSI